VIARDETAVIRAAASSLGLALSEQALTRILRFSGTLATWNRTLRLTAERDPVHIAERHIADSLAPACLLPASGLVVDIGSGQGFPGIILGCVAPHLELVLIEARRRRASFLRDAVRHVPLPRARVLERRAEAADGTLAGRAQLVVTRALRLDAFLALARPLLAADGVAIAMQSPQGAARAPALVERAGVRVREDRRYVLPDGSPRALLVLSTQL
jgi:16S rRNA (guanine527-N7)-methyltransferase